MKKRMNKAIILSLVLVLTACNNWLDVSPKSDMKADDLFLTEAGFRVDRCLCANVQGGQLCKGFDVWLSRRASSILQESPSVDLFGI